MADGAGKPQGRPVVPVSGPGRQGAVHHHSLIGATAGGLVGEPGSYTENNRERSHFTYSRVTEKRAWICFKSQRKRGEISPQSPYSERERTNSNGEQKRTRYPRMFLTRPIGWEDARGSQAQQRRLHMQKRGLYSWESPNPAHRSPGQGATRPLLLQW